jgi:CHAT domain-containing protein/tetratricopeptide (TPR) repeat protein
LVVLGQALSLFTQANDQKGIGASRDALGDLYNRQGQYDAAFSHYAESANAFNRMNDLYNRNLSVAKAAEMLFRKGDYANTLATYNRMTVTKPDTNPVSQTAGKVGKVGGIIGGIRSGNVGGAVSAGAGVASMIIEERNAYKQFMVYAIYEVGLGRLDYAQGNYEGAKKHFENALSAADNPFYGKFGQGRRWRIASRTSLGDVALIQNRYSDAIKLYDTAIKDAKKENRLDLVWQAQRGLGKTYWAQAAQEKDPKKATQGRENAVASYREALTNIETIRQGSLSADESRSTFLSTTKDVYDEAVVMLAERALIQQPNGTNLSGAALNDAAEAFKIAEQSRARSLLDMLSEAGSNLSQDVPSDLLQRKQQIQARQQEIAQTLTGASFSEETNKKSNADLEKELDTLATDLENVEAQIRTANPRYASLTKPQPLTLQEAQQQILDDKTTLLEYSLGKDASYLWAVTQSSVSLFKLPARKTIDEQAIAARVQMIPAKLRSPIAGINLPPAQATRGLGLNTTANAGPAAGFATASNTLYQTVVAPASSVIGTNRILVVPDGALNYIPFEALVTQPGGTDYAALPYLVKTNEIAYAPSASVVAVIRKQSAAKSTSKSILLVADPVFNSDDPRAKGITTTTTTGADTRGLGLSSALTDVAGTPSATSTGAPAQGLMLARLQGTRTEAEQIAKLMQTSGGKADLLLDLNANEENVQIKDLKNYRVIHIATHGLLNAERPQFTGVVLSLVGNKQYDGFLRTNEIFNLRLGAPLVMLSACETGLGKEKRGEGVIGLTRAFMYAGAPTVGVSLWSVADASTALLMSDFYKRMLTGQGMSPNAAMRESQKAMIDSKKYSAPFFWAPFVLVGDWR